MNRLRAWIRSYFGFSRTETNGFLVLLPLMAVLIFSEPVYRWWFINYQTELPDESKKLDSLIATWKWDAPVNHPVQQVDSTKELAITPRLFAFDPNKASKKDLRSLGVSEKVAGRIINYRTKGGKFRTRKDFGKIYGMDSTLLKTLNAYIDLPETPERPNIPFEKSKAKSSLPKHEPVDLNLADTTALIKIYGIGSKRAKRIISYRTRLGGFVAIDQLTEVYGLDSTVIAQLGKATFIEAGFVPRQININVADKKELTGLPYVKFNLANAIATYRFQHGNFVKIEDLKQIVSMDDLTFQKIKPYLTVKD
jgi:competence protein ComEA